MKDNNQNFTEWTVLGFFIRKLICTIPLSCLLCIKVETVEDCQILHKISSGINKRCLKINGRILPSG